MMRIGLFFWFALAAIAAVLLFRVSQEVAALEAELTDLNQEIVAEHVSIRILRAEWAFLNRPERLRALAAALTGLEPMRSDQVIRTAAAVPLPLPEPGMPAEVALVRLPGLDSLPLPPRHPNRAAPVAPVARSAEPAPPAAAAPAAPPRATVPADPAPRPAVRAPAPRRAAPPTHLQPAGPAMHVNAVVETGADPIAATLASMRASGPYVPPQGRLRQPIGSMGR